MSILFNSTISLRLCHKCIIIFRHSTRIGSIGEAKSDEPISKFICNIYKKNVEIWLHPQLNQAFPHHTYILLCISILMFSCYLYIFLYERIQYKILCLVFNSLTGKSPVYLRNLLTLAPVVRSGLRSNEQYRRLLVPFTKLKTFAARSFSCIGPYWWNRLPNYIRQHNDINCSKKT